jgi:hypothetical protein
LFFFYQKNRLERINSIGHNPGDESDNFLGSSAATTVVRKTAPMGKHLPRLSNAFDGALQSNPIEQNHKTVTNNDTLEQLQHRASMRQSSAKPNSNPFQSNYTGQQILLTSGDIESMTMKQFRISSLGC